MGERLQSLEKFSADIALSTFFTEIIHYQNLEKTREHIKSKKGSALIYANHFNRFDSMVIGKTIKDHISPLGNNLSVIVSKQYTDLNRTENHTIVKALSFLQDAYGIRLLSVVQDKPEEKTLYPDWKIINIRVAKEAVRILRVPGNIVGIMPEGTRNPDKLGPAEAGFETILKHGGSNVLVQPLALSHAKIKPLTMRTQIFAPEPFTYEELLEEQRQNPQFNLTTLAMQKIARELKPEEQGAYKLDI